MIVWLKLMMCRIGFWLWFKTRGYYLWSKFWRALLERFSIGAQMTRFESLPALEDRLASMVWSSDRLNGVVDIISRPETVEWYYQKGTRPPHQDCDEFAIYAANRIAASLPYTPYFLSIVWLDRKGGFHGHNVCAFTDPRGTWAHIGNWNQGRAVICGAALEDVVRNIYMPSGGGRLVGWALATPELRLVKMRVG